MRGGLTAAALRTQDRLQGAVDAVLDARLDRGSTAPVALGLSGGGDSLALLHLAADWCARVGRPLLAFTVDHGLHPDSGAWTAAAGAMAAGTGAAWRPLAWGGLKPATGLPAAARAARHALLAEATRMAGARVLLLGHTADDLAETAWMGAGEARGIGTLRAWAPSPAWPDGRGVFLLRPLLDARRAELRAWLGARAFRWFDDPANADTRFARARARAAAPPIPLLEADTGEGFGEAGGDGCVRLPRSRLAADPQGRRVLRAALACAAGGSARARGAVVDRLLARLAGSDELRATAGGAWVRADADEVRLGREPGRSPPLSLMLAPGEAAVWDGRFEVCAYEAGWRVMAAGGRDAQPMFVRGVEARPPGGGLVARSLIGARFDAAVGRVRREAQISYSDAHS